MSWTIIELDRIMCIAHATSIGQLMAITIESIKVYRITICNKRRGIRKVSTISMNENSTIWLEFLLKQIIKICP